MPPPPPRCPPPPPGPPPAPGPPPPPIFNSPKNSSKSSSGDGRNLLLESIRQGKSLKKTVTVDKSAPVIGKLPNNSSAGSGSMNSRNGSGSAAPGVAIGAGGNPLAGLFAGGMPKLKSTGRDIGQSNNSSSDSQSSSNRSSPEQTRPGVGAKKPTSPFPKQANINVRRQPSTETKRGPPPQPPAPKSPLPNSTSDSVLTGPARHEMGSTSSRSQSSNMNTLQNKNFLLSKNMQINSNNNDLPNQSSLFGNKSNLHASLSSLHQTKQLTVNTQNLGQSLTNLSNQNNVLSKPVINHGKPNLAPKPPALNPPGPTVKRGVSRAQSMRVPSTPPSTTPTQPMWPISGTLRGCPQGFYQSQENFRASKPAPGIPVTGVSSRPNIPPPPRPPASRPPPPPSRSTSNANTLHTSNSSTSNLSNMNYNHTRSQSTLSQTSVTSNNGTSYKSNNPVNTTGMNVPPPPPPHRNTPAPPPPNKAQLCYGVPAPPLRHSSMRNGASSDLESRFGDRFHSVVDFPPPMPFYKIPKEYNSKMVNNQVSKQPSLSKPQAPPPPDRIAATHITFDTKLFANNTSNC